MRWPIHPTHTGCVLLLAGVAISMWSCSSSPSTNYEEMQTVRIHSLDLTMRLPSSYQEVGLDEEIEYWINSGEPKEVIDNNISFLEGLRDGAAAHALYADSLEVNNSMRMLRMPPAFKIGKYLQKEGFLALDESVQEQGELLQVRYEPMENKYFTLKNGNEILKIRYRTTKLNTATALLASAGDYHLADFQDEPTSWITTFYVVNGGRGSLMVTVNHMTEDFEWFMRTITFEP